MSTLDHGPHGTTETGAAYSEAARVRALAEANAPARLLGVAQAAIRDALLLNDPAEIHAHLAEVLTRIKPEVAA